MSTGLPTVLGFAGAWWWVFDLLSHFRAQYALGAGLAVLLAAVVGKRRAALVACTSLVVNLALMGPFYAGGSGLPRDDDRLLIMTHNVHTANRAFEQVAQTIEAEQPDVVLLLEVDRAWMTALSDLAESYTIVAEPHADNFGIALLSRLPILEGGILDLPDAPGLPVVAVRLDWGGTAFDLLGVHTVPPISPRASALRDTQMARAAERIADSPGPAMLVGDLNATPWSHPFRAVVDETGLRNSQRGFGLQPSWPRFPWPFSIPIDHLLHSEHFVVTDRRVGDVNGSDHRTLLVEIAWASRR